MNNLKRKLTSRKLWVSVAAFVTLVMLHKGADQGTADSIAAIIMAAATVIAYVVGEGFVDAEHANVQDVQETSVIGFSVDNNEEDEEDE